VPIAGIAPFLKVCLGERGPKQVPSLLEISPRVFKIDGGAVKLPPWMHAGVKAANPFPLIAVERDTWADRDRADPHITQIDVPQLGVPGIGGGLARAFLY
jgi:hypothetical protein